MDQLSEIRLNDDKLYSQLINYKYRTSKNRQSKEDKNDEMDEDSIEDANKQQNQHNKRIHHHRHRKNRIKLTKSSNLLDSIKDLVRDNVDRLDNRFINKKERIKKKKFKIKENSIDNLIKFKPNVDNLNDKSSRLVIDLEAIDSKSNELSNQTNCKSDNSLVSDELMLDYDNYFLNNTVFIDNLKQKSGKSNSNVKDSNNLTYNSNDFNDYDSIEIINLSIDEQPTNQTMKNANNSSDNLNNEYLDSSGITNLLISSTSNRLVLNELNETNLFLSDDENELKRIDSNQTDQLEKVQQEQNSSDFKMSRLNADSDEGFIYELDLLDNALNEFSDYQFASNRQIFNNDQINHQFINQQLIIDNKFINQQHNQLIDNQFVVDSNRPKFSSLTSSLSSSSSNKNNLTANVTILGTTLATALTSKLLLNLSNPNHLFTPNLMINTTNGAYSDSLNTSWISSTAKPSTPPPFSYWLTILIAVLIAIASLITIIGNLLVSIYYLILSHLFNLNSSYLCA